jgi:hypothetical protein
MIQHGGAMSRGDDFSPADLAALAALAESAKVTHNAVQVLARAVANPGVMPDQPDKPKGRRRIKVARDAAGNLAADIEDIDTGRTRRTRVTRNGDGELEVVDEAEEEPMAPGKLEDAAPRGFDGLFGSIEDPRP